MHTDAITRARWGHRDNATPAYRQSNIPARLPVPCSPPPSSSPSLIAPPSPCALRPSVFPSSFRAPSAVLAFPRFARPRSFARRRRSLNDDAVTCLLAGGLPRRTAAQALNALCPRPLAEASCAQPCSAGGARTCPRPRHIQGAAADPGARAGTSDGGPPTRVSTGERSP